ncbi:unnamed protein product [Cylindrotheca closterium]|uniref:No apical meristem-associated C-terminal domain-containing protein n=1 Tax=Cylindrotheca closterium TaxID=2856 RepID=A0AAD2FND0_9STRA|nr:unnamed protein product [Cylindrotheca closterium]
MANVGSAKPPHWSQEEIKALAIAHRKVSEDPVEGVKQTGATYHARIVEEWTKQAPSGDDRRCGTWSDRNGDTVANYLRDSIKAKCPKFNAALMAVDRAKPTGVDEKQQLNMAYAFYIENTKKIADHEFKDFDIKKWRFYDAWKILKDMRYFESEAANNLCGRDANLPSPGSKAGRPKGTKLSKVQEVIERRQASREAYRKLAEVKHEERHKEVAKRIDTLATQIQESTASLQAMCETMVSQNKLKTYRSLMKVAPPSKKQKLQALINEESQNMLEGSGLSLDDVAVL